MDLWPAIANRDYSCFKDDCQRSGIIDKDFECVQSRIERKVVAWHPECWLVDAFRLLRENPRQAPQPGRPPLDLNPQDRNKRERIIRHRAAYKLRRSDYQDRLRHYAEGSVQHQRYTLLVQVQTLKMDGFWWEIQNLGGAPPAWDRPATEIVKV